MPDAADALYLKIQGLFVNNLLFSMADAPPDHFLMADTCALVATLEVARVSTLAHGGCQLVQAEEFIRGVDDLALLIDRLGGLERISHSLLAKNYLQCAQVADAMLDMIIDLKKE
jgi:hypothetical protein